MKGLRAFLVFGLVEAAGLAATFGTVVQHAQPISDLVLDDARKRIYLVNPGTSQVEVYNTAVNPPRLLATVGTDNTPLAAAISRSGRFLYVACYGGSSLDVVDLASGAFGVSSISLAEKPEAVAVGFDEKVLISTTGTSAAQSVLITYDPNASGAAALKSLPIAPPAPSVPALPPPNGVMALAAHAHLRATPDGRTIVGVHELANNTRTVFVYEAASSTVLSARNLAAISPVLAVSPDGSKFVSGPLLFDTATLLVLAQQNATNAPYSFTGTPNFNTQTTQGGAVFAPDGSVLLTAYDIAPVGATRSNIAQLMVNTPDGMLIQLGIQLPENLNDRMVISADGANVYAISQSGFTVIPVGTLQQSPIAIPDSNVALLQYDQCGVAAQSQNVVIPVRNAGGGRITVTAALNTTVTTSPQVRVTTKTYGADLTATFNTTQANRSLGTAAPDVVLIQSPEAVNIPPNIRVFQNNRNSEARGTIIPVDIGATTTGLTDMLSDPTRPRLYIANPGLNRIEVFDTQQQQFLAPIPVGQLPRSLAFGNDSNTLYVANSGGESIGIVDLVKGSVAGRVQFPALPFNTTIAPITPSVIASTSRGPQVVMSDGTLWKIVGNTLVPRTLNPIIFGTATRVVTAPVSMASSSDGSFMLLLSGTGAAFLYSAAQDDFIAGKQVVNTPITGYFGAVSAGPGGAYYLAGDQLLNSALTSSTGGAGGSRPVAASVAINGQAFVRYSMPFRPNAATAPADPGLVEVVDPTNGRTLASASTLEGPLTAAITGQRANINGRTIAADAAGGTVFVLTATGLSVVTMASAGAAPVITTGMVNIANYQPAVAPGGLVAVFGRNLAANATSSGNPLPGILGGTCVTLNNSPLPLLATSDGQINAQIPPTLAAGRYPLVVRSLTNMAASATVNVTVSKYAPAIFVDATGPAIYHRDGTRLDKDHPGVRDEPLTMYATGLGVTTGGKVLAGVPAPSSPLAVSSPVLLYFGDPTRSDTGVIIDWSGLMPGYIGVYQINCRIPGTHEKGDGLPITLKIGGVSSPVTGANVPLVWVR